MLAGLANRFVVSRVNEKSIVTEILTAFLILELI